MEEQNIRIALDRHWAASAVGDQVAEHEIYHDDTVCEYPQSGEVIHGRRNLQALRSHHPGRPSGFVVRRIVGAGNLWVTEYVITYEGRRAYTVSMMEFRMESVARDSIFRRSLRRSCLARSVGRAGGVIDGIEQPHPAERGSAVRMVPAMPPARPLMRSGRSLEYGRAYGYWEMPPSPYDQFVQAYADTASVQLIVQPPCLSTPVPAICTRHPDSVGRDDA